MSQQASNRMTYEEIKNLHVQGIFNQGARQALLMARQAGALLQNETGRYKAYNRVYSDAIYDACLQDVTELEMWLSGSRDGYFYDHERNKKGRLVRCKYTWDKRKAEAAWKAGKEEDGV